MKITIDVEIQDEAILKALENNKAIAEVAAAISTSVNLKIKADFAKIVIDVCKAQNIPLADLVSSKS